MIHYTGYEADPYKSLTSGKMNYKQLVDNIDFNAKPISDNSPFFYNNSKFIPNEMIYIIVMIITIFLSIRKKYITKSEEKKATIYFAALGIAFMLVEIPMVQKMVLYFGSLISGTNKVKKLTYKSPYYILLTGIMIIIIQFNLTSILNLTKDFNMIYKFLVVFTFLFHMGLLMGMAFPSGIRKIGNIENEQSIVPLMYGINGIFSVLGSTLAIIISMKFGFNVTIDTGAAIYIILFILNPLKIFCYNFII